MIVISRRNKDLGLDTVKEPMESLERIAVDPRAVKQIAAEQQQITAAAQLRKLQKRLPLFPTALRRLLRRQSGERRVQMQVGGVDQLNHGRPPSRPLCSGPYRR